MAQPSLGVAMLLSFLFGALGVDKFYVGATGLGVLQLVLTLTLVGLLVSVPWAMLSTFVLGLAILTGGVPFLYPAANWAPISQGDKLILGVIVVLVILGMVSNAFSKVSENFPNVADKIATKFKQVRGGKSPGRPQRSPRYSK
jgi:TM2 domain-containing membrane protein YozV